MSQQYIGTARWGTVTNQAYTGTASTVITVGAQVYARCASGNDGRLCADRQRNSHLLKWHLFARLAAEYVTVNPGQTITAVQVSAGGSLQVTECL
jgi:hypothetical protein